MLTEHFINLCCVVSLDENPKFTQDIFSDINLILNFYKESDISLNFKNKYNLCKTVLKLRLDKLKKNQIIDNINVSGKFKELESFLLSLNDRVIESDQIDLVIKQIRDRKKYTIILKDMPLLENYIKQFNTNSFSDLDEILKNWDLVINQSHSRIVEEKKYNSVTKITNIDLSDSSYKAVLDQIENSYCGKNSISTGYSELNSYMNGGFEPSRLYIFAGSSGDGKSVLLMNFLKNGVERSKENHDKKEIYIYFTLENLIDESLIRLYCCLTKQSIKDVMKDYDENRQHIENYIKKWQDDNNSIVIMAYFPPTLTSVSDLMGFIEEIEYKYNNIAVIKGVYVDYLDLLKSGQNFDLYRLAMGQITIDLKVAAVIKSVPVVSLTQTNRSSYDNNQPQSLAQIGEAIKKVENADFVALIKSLYDEQQTNITPGFVSGYIKFITTIKKNRSGPKEKIINLLANFEHYRIDDNSRDISVPFENPSKVQDGFI